MLAAAGLVWALAAEAAGSPVAPAPTPAGPAGVGVRLLDGPDGRPDDPQAQAYIVDHLSPGDQIERHLEVTNPASVPQRVDLYPAAATVDDDDGFTFAPEATGNELTSWVRLDQTVLDLPPGGRRTVAVAIAVSEQATTGEHYGVVWAQVAAGPAGSAGVQHIGRAGIRVYLSVGSGQGPVADFQVDRLAASRDPAGAPVVSARVQNTGGRALDLAGELALSDGPAGLAAGPYPVRLETLGVGATGLVQVPLDPALPDGSWQARLTLASGHAERTATATITLGSGAAGATRRPASRIAMSLAALTALGLGGGTVWLLRGYRGYRRRRIPDAG